MQTLFTCLKKISVTAVLATSLAAGVPAISQATPMLRYTIASTSGVGTLLGPGMVSAGTGTISGVTYSFTGTSKPALGSAEKPVLDLFSLSLKNAGSVTTADVWLTDTGFSGHTTPLGLLSSYGGTLTSLTGSGTAQFWSYADSSNAAWGVDTPLQDSGLISSVGFFGGDLYSSHTLTSPFSLTLHARFKLGTGTSITSADQSISVPEPGVLGMVGLGLLMVGLMGLRFRQARYRGDHSKA